MGNFCRQCSIDFFGVDFQDLAGLTKPEDWKTGEAVVALCECCGPIQVDPDGNCVSDCSYDGQPGHNCPWIGDSNGE